MPSWIKNLYINILKYKYRTSYMVVDKDGKLFNKGTYVGKIKHWWARSDLQ